MSDDIIRYDIISDTHGYVSEELQAAISGADVIIHAGDCCSLSDYEYFKSVAHVVMCLGNNDWGMDYGPSVKRLTRSFMSGLRWQVCHYRERLDLETADIAICGHTHKPFVQREKGVLVMNPGSPTYPRTTLGATMGRIYAQGDNVISAKIIRLHDGGEQEEIDSDALAGFGR